MAIKNILKMGNPMLRDKAKEVDSKHINSLEMQNIVRDMVDTLEEAGGIVNELNQYPINNIDIKASSASIND